MSSLDFESGMPCNGLIMVSVEFFKDKMILDCIRQSYRFQHSTRIRFQLNAGHPLIMSWLDVCFSRPLH